MAASVLPIAPPLPMGRAIKLRAKLMLSIVILRYAAKIIHVHFVATHHD